MTDQLPLAPANGRTTTRIVMVDPASVRISSLNPRVDTPADLDSIAKLGTELKIGGQVNDAHAETAKDGVLEILAGSRRCAACLAAGIELRVRVHSGLSREEAIRIAYRGDYEAVSTSFWDLSGGWQKLLGDSVVKTESGLADLVGIDKSTMSRGLAFRKAPEAILGAFTDVRAISMTQWADLAPLIENEDTRARLLERAALIVGKGYGATRVAAELRAAAAGKQEIKPIEVRNRHERIIATIQPGHRSDFTIKVKPLAEAHPSYRLEYAKVIHDKFVEVVKGWFDA